MKLGLIILFFFCSCTQYYYYDAKGEHTTYDRKKEKEVTKVGDQYYFVLRGKNIVGSGSLFDTTNWQQMKIDLLNTQNKINALKLKLKIK